MVGMRATLTVLGLVSIAILARLLTPEDFGIVALAGSAFAFLSLLGQFGFDWALIQYKDPEPDHYSTAWTANIITGLIIAVATAAVAGPVAVFFDDARIEVVVYVFAALSFLKGFENIGIVNFRKNLEFGGDFLYFVIPKIVSVFVSVAAALLLRNYWALVLGMMASQVTAVIYSNISQPFRPRLTLSRFRDLFGFSRWILVNRFLTFFATQGPEVILGRLRTTADVGVLQLGQKLAFLPTTELLAPLNRALFPGFSYASDDMPRLQKMLQQILAMTALVALPSVCGIFAVRDVLVLVVFGDKWLAVAPVIGVLAFVGLLEAIASIFRPILLARGTPKAIAIEKFCYVAIALPIAVALVPERGAMGVAIALVIGSAITKPYVVVVAALEIEQRMLNILAAIWRPLIASAAMILAISAMSSAIAALALQPYQELLLLVAGGAAVYTSVIGVLWLVSGKPEGAERKILGLVNQRLKKSID
jgi:PST family polysaccharide transporter